MSKSFTDKQILGMVKAIAESLENIDKSLRYHTIMLTTIAKQVAALKLEQKAKVKFDA
jgi:hypothetical protein